MPLAAHKNTIGNQKGGGHADLEVQAACQSEEESRDDPEAVAVAQRRAAAATHEWNELGQHAQHLPLHTWGSLDKVKRKVKDDTGRLADELPARCRTDETLCVVKHKCVT